MTQSGSGSGGGGGRAAAWERQQGGRRPSTDLYAAVFGSYLSAIQDCTSICRWLQRRFPLGRSDGRHSAALHPPTFTQQQCRGRQGQQRITSAQGGGATGLERCHYYQLASSTTTRTASASTFAAAF